MSGDEIANDQLILPGDPKPESIAHRGKSVVIDCSPPPVPTAEEKRAFKEEALKDPEHLAQLRRIKAYVLENGLSRHFDVGWIPDEDEEQVALGSESGRVRI